MASKARITDKQLKAWQANPPKSAQACGDGLYFRAYASGSAQWYYRYTLAGKPRWHKLGNYPGLTLAEARKELRKQKVSVDQGTDVALDAQLERKRQTGLESFKAAAMSWYARVPERKLNKPTIVLRRMEIHIFPVLGKFPIDRVKPRDIGELVSSIGEEKPTVANKVLSDIQQIYKHANKYELVPPGYNPAAHFDWTDAGGSQAARDRVLSDTELKILFKAAASDQSFGRVNELSLFLLLATCERKMAVLSARWDAIDLNKRVWLLEKSTNKSRYSVAIPLAGPVVQCLRELRVLSGRSNHVFPTRRVSRQNRFPHVGPDTLNRAHDALGNMTPAEARLLAARNSTFELSP